MDIKILVVDDDAETCEYLKELLQLDGYQADTLSDPNGVVDRLREGQHHMVIVDLMMPGRTGLDVLREVRDYDKNIVTMILTGYPTIDTAIDALKLNACDYLRKPFEVDDFREAVRRALDKHGIIKYPEAELHRTIGKNIRAFREQRGLKLRHLANRTGLSVSLLSQIERGESPASVSSLYKVAVALDHKVREFFGDF